MKARQFNKNLLKFSRLAVVFVLAVMLMAVCGLNIGSKNYKVNDVVSAKTHNAGNNSYKLSADGRIPLGVGETFHYDILTGTGISGSTYSSFHRYSDGEFWAGNTTIYPPGPIYSSSEIYTRTRSIGEGGETEYYAYFELPKEFVHNKAKLSVSMNYETSRLHNVNVVRASLLNIVDIPTDSENRGKITSGYKKETTGNGSFVTDDYIFTASNKYLRIGFAASASSDIGGANTAVPDMMLFAIKNVKLTIKVLGDDAGPTITPWEFLGSDLEPSHAEYANTVSDMEMLFDTYYTIENHGKVNCHNLKYQNGILDKRDSPEENLFTSWQNIENKTISFVVFDKFMGLKEVRIGDYAIASNATVKITEKAELQQAMADNPELKLKGISKIQATSFGYRTIDSTTGYFRGMQILITFDGKEADGSDIIGNTQYSIVGVDNGGVNSFTTVTIGGMDRSIPEVPAFNILDSTVTANGRVWYSNTDIRYRLKLAKADDQRNVTYTHTLIRCDESGIEVETILDNEIVSQISYGIDTKSNNFKSLISGQYKYFVRATDAAGNTDVSEEYIFWLDTIIPECDIDIFYKNTTEEYTLGTWSNGELEVKFNEIECISGYYYEYRIDNGIWIRENSETIILGSDGRNIESIYTFRVATNAGKVSEEYSTPKKIMIDTTNPGQPYSTTLVSYFDLDTGYDGTAPIKMYVDVLGDDTGQEKQYSDLFMFYYVVGNEIDGRIVYGGEQSASMSLASRGEAIIDLYQDGIPDFSGESFLIKHIKMWSVDQAGNRSEQDTELKIYVLPPVIYVDFIIADIASKVYDNNNKADNLVMLEVRDSRNELISSDNSSTLKEQIIDVASANQRITLNYLFGETIYINDVAYQITNEGLAGSGFSYYSGNNALNEVVLTASKKGVYKFSNFKINYSPIFVNRNVGLQDITLDVLSSGKYIEIEGSKTENFTIKYRCNDGLIIDIAEDCDGVIIGNALIEKAKILMFYQYNNSGKIVPISANSKIYDGTTNAYLPHDNSTFVCTTYVEGEGWKAFSWDGMANYENADVLAYNGIVADKNILITELILLGDSDELMNYEVIIDINSDEVADFNTIFEIKSKILYRELIIDTQASKIKQKFYDRTTNAEMESLVFKGSDEFNNILEGEDVSAKFSLEFASFAVNDNVAVTMKDIVLTGDNAINYVYVGAKTVNLLSSINRRPLTILDLTIKNKTYDGNNSAELLNCSLSGVLSLDSTFVNVTYVDAVFDLSEAGNHFGTVNGLALTGIASKNYIIVDDEGNAVTVATTTSKARIDKRILSVSAVAENKIYDGTAIAYNTVLSLSGMLSNDKLYIGTKLDNFEDIMAYTGAKFMFNDNEVLPIKLLSVAFNSSSASTISDSVVYIAYGKYVKYDEALHEGKPRYKVAFRESNIADFYVLNEQGYYEIYDSELHSANLQKYAVDEVEANESGAYVIETFIYNADGSVNNNYTFENNLTSKAGMRLFTTARARITKKQASAEIVGLIATDSSGNVLYKDDDGNLYVKNGDKYDVYDVNGNKTGNVNASDMVANIVYVNELEYGGYFTLNNILFRLGSINYTIKYSGGNLITLQDFVVEEGDVKTFSFAYREGQAIVINGYEYVLGVDTLDGVIYNGMFNDMVSLTFDEGAYLIQGEEYEVFRSLISNGYGITSPVNNYNIMISQVANDNYDFSGRLQGISISIIPAKLTVSINTDYNFNFGDQFTLNDLRVNYQGFRNSENITVFGNNKPYLVLTDKNGNIISITDETRLSVDKYCLKINLPKLQNYEYVILDTTIDGVAVYTLTSETVGDVTTYFITKKNAIAVNLGTLINISFNSVSTNYNNTTYRLLANGYPSNAKTIYSYYLINSDGSETLIEGVNGVINAGKYRVNVLIKGNDSTYGYADYNASAFLTINKAKISITIDKSIVVNYSGSSVNIASAVMTPDSIVTNIQPNSIKYQYSEDKNFKTLCSAPSSVGVFYARAYFAGNNNYEVSYSNIATIRINPIYIPIVITSGKKFNILDYFDEYGSPLYDEYDNEIIFNGIEFETIEEYEDYLDYVYVYYMIDGYWSEEIPTEQGVYNFKIVAESPYALLGDGMSGTMLIGVNKVDSYNSSISVLDGALPSTSDDDAYYYVKTLEYEQNDPIYDTYKTIVSNNSGKLNGNYDVNKLLNIQFFYTPDSLVNEEIADTGSSRMVVSFRTNAPLAKGAKLVYIDSNGVVNELATSYNPNTGMLSFETSSLGTFAILEPVKVKLNTQMVAIICAGAVAFLLLVALVITIFANRQRKMFKASLSLASQVGQNESADEGDASDDSDE